MDATLATLTRLTRDPASPDAALLDAFLAGDQSAFAALVRRHAGLVFAACRRVLRHQQDAEDAFQATFLVLARRAADVWPREAVGSWLFGVAHRVALKARAVRARRVGRERPLEDQAGPIPASPDCDLAEAVHRVVGKLPDVYRAAVIACDLQGLSRKEAAAQLGWTEGTLSGRLARARGLLATRLRRLGFALPAGGLAAFYVAPDAASASLVRSTISLATGAAVGGVSAPVAALTEGVVQGMALFKLKAIVAVVCAACALGFGAFTASGSGDGQQSQAQGDKGAATAPVKPLDPPAKPTAAPPKGPRVELAQHELRVIIQDLEANKKKIDPVALERVLARLDAIARLLDEKDLAMHPTSPASDLAALQGTWRVVSTTEGGKDTATDPKDPWVIEVRGDTLTLPYKEADGWKTRAYKIALDGSQPLKAIDLTAGNAPVGRGIYEFTAPASACVKCHQDPFVWKGVKPNVEALALCGPGLAEVLKRPAPGLRLALSVDGTRPTKFGGMGVIVFEMTRAADKGDPRAADLLAAMKERDLQLMKAAAQEEWARARIELQRAQVQAEAAQRGAAEATANLKAAQDKLAAAEKAVADLKKSPAPAVPNAGAEFTVHVRTLTAAEKVARVKATGSETVLDGLAHAHGLALKPDAVSVWVVRDGAVLPVDLGAIAQQGVTKTNYVLKPGDQLFVQAKAGK